MTLLLRLGARAGATGGGGIGFGIGIGIAGIAFSCGPFGGVYFKNFKIQNMAIKNYMYTYRRGHGKWLGTNRWSISITPTLRWIWRSSL
jgi:hypothetical protein